MQTRGAGYIPSPLVFWDGFGLWGGYSGILTHALELFNELEKSGITPFILGDVGIERNFPMESLYLIRSPLRLMGVHKIKLIWPMIIEQNLLSLVGKKRHIVHGLSNFNIPLSAPKSNQKRVLTIHDVIPLLDPTVVSASYAIQFKIAISRAISVVDRIICVSNWTMQCLLSFYPEIEDRCLVIKNGINKSYGPNKKKYFDGSIELLCIARYEKYKRFSLLFEICSKLPQYYSLNVVTDLRGREFCEKNAAGLIASQRLNIHVGISSEKLQDLYNKSHVYIHPSLYEGFNIPAIEAVKNGLPVVYTKGTGTEEVVGSKLGVGMTSKSGADYWIEAIKECVKNLTDIQWRLSAQAALEDLPTWHQNAVETKKIYEELE